MKLEKGMEETSKGLNLSCVVLFMYNANYFLQYYTGTIGDTALRTTAYLSRSWLILNQFPPDNWYYRTCICFYKPTLLSHPISEENAKYDIYKTERANGLSSVCIGWTDASKNKIKQIDWWNFDRAEFGWIIGDTALITLNVSRHCMVKTES